jgi:hypothetical protein
MSVVLLLETLRARMVSIRATDENEIKIMVMPMAYVFGMALGHLMGCSRMDILWLFLCMFYVLASFGSFLMA